jgi:hypothetical protein
LAAAAFLGGQSRLKAGCGQDCPPSNCKLACRSAVSNYPNGFFDVMMRLVDVLQRSQLQPLRKAIVLFMRDIVVRLVDQFKSAMQAARPVEPGINGRVIVEILAVVNRGPLDLADGLVDLMDRFLLLFPQFSVSGAFQVGSGVP